MKANLLTAAIWFIALFSVDLAYGYHPVSPYAYCNNNPVRYVDPNGMEIAESSKDEWEQQKATIQSRADRMQNRLDRLVSKGASESRIANLSERIAGVTATLGTMGTLESSSQVYALAAINPGEMGGLSYSPGSGVITIGYNGTANFVHEVTHGGQFESGGVAFLNSGGTIGQDVFDEVAAYRAQYAYDPTSVAGLTSSSAIRSAADINPAWVQGIVHNGTYPYAPGGITNTGIAPIGVNSNREALIRAYPHLRQTLLSMPANATLRSLPSIYYKR